MFSLYRKSNYQEYTFLIHQAQSHTLDLTCTQGSKIYY